jgi:hypothetical protein
LHHDTVLVHRDGPGLLRAESVPAATLSTLESVGLRESVEPAIFLRQYGVFVAWQSDAVQQLQGAAPRSVLIERMVFDAQLRAAAIDSGARMVHASSVASPTRRAPHRWSIQAQDGDGPAIITTTFVVDARGKQRRDNGSAVAARTAAMSAVWEQDGRSEATTRLEALEDAWCWGMPAGDRRYSATVFLDEHKVAGSDAAGRTRLYRQLLARTTLLRHLLDGEPVYGVNVCDATAGLSRELIGDDFIRVGEAAWSIDPLSSQGLHCALVSALQGAAAVHTMCSGGDSAAAAEFYVSRQRRAATSAFDNTALAYAQRQGPDRCSFWKRRSAPPSTDLPARTTPRLSPAGPLPTTIAVSPELRIVDAPLLVGNVIVRGKALSHPRLTEPVAFFKGVPLVPLLDLVRDDTATNTIVNRWAERLPPDVADTIFSWMYAAGLVLDSSADMLGRRHPAR